MTKRSSHLFRAEALALLLAASAAAACVDVTAGGAPDPAACRDDDDHVVCTYAQAGDLALEADVYGAEEAAQVADGRPALLWIHGGALLFGHRAELADAAEQLEGYLARGYVVVSIDYRLAPATPLDQIQADVAAAHTWLRAEGPARFGIDPDRIGVIGHSAGGYLALSLGHRAAPPPRAIVSFYGYGTLDWYSALGGDAADGESIADDDPDVLAVRRAPPSSNTSLDELDRRLTFYAYCRQTGRWPIEVGGRDPAADPAYFAAFEPARHVTGEFPPTMLLHGQRDDDVPFSEAASMFVALDEAGVDVALLHDGLARFEGARFEHGFDEDMDAPGVRDAFGEVLDFLDETLRDAPLSPR